MKKLMSLIREGESVQRVLRVTADMSQLDLDALGSISDDEHTILEVWAAKSANVVGVEHTVSIGCILCILNAASATESRREVFTRVLNELQISRTQAYRSMAVWQRSGKMFCDSSDLAYMFVPEALKLLCESKSPDRALEEAFEMAKNGMAVDIKAARRLRAVHRESYEQADESPSVVEPGTLATESSKSEEARSTGLFRVFTGRVVKIALEFRGNPDDIERKSIIDDILAFVNELAESRPNTSDQTAIASS
ncbi:MAG: hypothetical protein AAFV88_12450 [Planctomycetota bacterium]